MKNRQRWMFAALAVCTFLSVLIYECLTPVLSDDFSYMQAVREASGIGDVFLQEARQYMSWTGRSVSHIILRLYLYTFGLHRGVFNVLAAAVFTLMTFLMYALVEREEADGKSALLLVLGVWLFGVRPGQTIFWLTGACNYLFTTTIILGMMALYRRYERAGEVSLRRILSMLAAGMLAGWCNENTSGGVVLFALLMLVGPYIEKRIGGAARQWAAMPIRAAMLAGVSAGYAMQLFSPGNHNRASLIEERHSGLLLYGARLLKVLAEVKSLFLPLLLVFLFLLLLVRRQGTLWRDTRLMNALLFFFLFLATAFCLVLAPDPQARTFFGPGIFLLIACAQLFVLVRRDGALSAALWDFAVYALLLIFVFRYFAEGGNLARIYRVMNARYALAEEGVRQDVRDADGDLNLFLPMLPKQFESPYTMAYDVDIHEAWNGFSNAQMAGYFGADYVLGVPYDEYYGGDAP